MPILVATSNQQLMFSSESWAGECGGSWRAQVIVVWDLLARIGTAEAGFSPSSSAKRRRMRPAGNRQASGGVSSRCPASTIFAGALPQIKCY